MIFQRVLLSALVVFGVLYIPTPVLAEGITTCSVNVTPNPYTYPSGNKRFIYSETGDYSQLSPADQDLIESGQLPLLGPSSSVSVSITTTLNAEALSAEGPFQITIPGTQIVLGPGTYTLSGNTFSFSLLARDILGTNISPLIKGFNGSGAEICRASDVANLFQIVPVQGNEVGAPNCSAVSFNPPLDQITSATQSVTATFPASGFPSGVHYYYYLSFNGTDINNTRVTENTPHILSPNTISLTVNNIASKAHYGGSFLLSRVMNGGNETQVCTFATFRTDPETGGVNPVEGDDPALPFELCLQTADAADTGPDYQECVTCYDQDKIWTAFGCVGTTKEGIVTSFIRIGIGLSGGFVLLSILYGAFLLTTSSGEPKRVQEGQEMISSAVMGLLFVIFSILILRFIGISILRIPGFGA